MQVRPKTNGIEPHELLTIEGQIKHGVNILHNNYNRLKNVKDAVHAYNVGVGNIKKEGKQNFDYVHKFTKEREHYIKDNEYGNS